MTPSSRCKDDIRTQLQDVVSSQYFMIEGDVPAHGTPVHLVIRKRPLVETPEGLAIGFLPPEYEYVMDCGGYEYAGEVVLSRRGAQPIVIINLEPSLK